MDSLKKLWKDKNGHWVSLRRMDEDEESRDIIGYVQSRNQSISWLLLPLSAGAGGSLSAVIISVASSTGFRYSIEGSFGGCQHRFPAISQSYLRTACFCSPAISSNVRSRLSPWCCCSKRCPTCQWWTCSQDPAVFPHCWVKLSSLR